MFAANPFAVLDSVEVNGADMKVDMKARSVQKKKKVVKKVNPVDSLKEDIAEFELENPIVAFFVHIDGKDVFMLNRFKLDNSIKTLLAAMGKHKISAKSLEDIINEKVKKPYKSYVWFSYFDRITLDILTKQVPFTAPPELKKTFDLFGKEPLTSLNDRNAIIFDFRMTQQKQEFLFLPNGKSISFGRTFDTFRIRNNCEKLFIFERYFERSLRDFNLRDVYDARDEIFKLTTCPETREFAYEAERFIARYVHLHDEDEIVELRRLLTFNNFEDLKSECMKAHEYQDILFKLLYEVGNDVYRKKIAQEDAVIDAAIFSSL